MHYTAVTPGYDNWQIKVKDTKIGKVKWITVSEYKSDLYEYGGSGKYASIYGVPAIWIVQVNDNWKKVGQIYIDSETGEILKVVINGKTLENTMPQGNQTYENTYASTNSTDTVDTTDQLPQDTSNNTSGIILAVTSILIIAGAVGYWFKIRK